MLAKVSATFAHPVFRVRPSTEWLIVEYSLLEAPVVKTEPLPRQGRIVGKGALQALQGSPHRGRMDLSEDGLWRRWRGVMCLSPTTLATLDNFERKGVIRGAHAG